MKRFLLFSICAVLFVNYSFGQDKFKPIELFDLNSVRVTDGPFKHAQEVNKKYLLALDVDRLMAPYLREAGLTPKKNTYTNWENTGLDGHIGGHYLTALSLMYAATADTAIYNRINYVLSELKRCQDNLNTGYIGGVPGSQVLWDDVKQGKIRAGNFDLNDKWVPLYNIHKIYAGLRDAYVLAGREDAKDMLIKLTAWSIDLISNLSEAQIQDMLRSEHGGLNEIFADVAAITGNPQYLELAVKFTDLKVLNPLIQGKDQLTGLHANTQIPKIIGVKRIADLEGKENWNNAARFFWETVVNNRSVAIGGNSASEHFHPADDFGNMISNIEGPETCNTYNMMKLSAQFYQSEGGVRYVDYYEKALYNHILSSQHPDHGGLVYFTPMRPDHYRVYSQPQTSFWCCVGSGIENHSKYGEFIYAHRDNELYINLFISSELNWKEKAVKIKQITSFPNEGRTKLIIDPAKKTFLDLKIRYPNWVPNAHLKVLVNGKQFNFKEHAGEYISIERFWKKGDSVEIIFDLDINIEQLPDGSDYFAYQYGPIVLAAKTSNDDLKGILADDSRGGHIAHGKQSSLQNVPYLGGAKTDLMDKVELISAKDLRFKLHGNANNTAASYELIPFYQLHDSRYIIYWPWKDSGKSETILIAKEDSLRQVQELTIDFVRCGQQQSESDHNVSYVNSSIGADNGIQWRNAKGQFSYVLKDPNQEALYLSIAAIDEIDGSFDLLIDGKKIEPIKAKNNYILYEVPSKKKEYVITIKSTNPTGTSKIKEVRLLKR